MSIGERLWMEAEVVKSVGFEDVLNCWFNRGDYYYRAGENKSNMR